MMKNGFKDTRLLEALDYIDCDLIGEVAVKLKFEENAPLTEEPVMTWRTPFKHWKRMLATAACLLLLSCAIPIINYVLPRVGVAIGGNAGAGTSDVEANEYDSPYKRAIDAYPADMPADEIYADVLKGGWVVKSEYFGGLTAGEDLWYSFFEETQNGEPSSVLFARYFTDNGNSIYLYEVVYNGETFNLKLFNCQTDVIDFQGEYEYLKKGIVEYTERGKLYVSEGYFLTNTDWITWEYLRQFKWSSFYSPEIGFANDYNYLIFELIYKNDELPYTDITTENETTAGIQYEYTPSIGSLEQISEVGVTVGNVTVEAQKHISAVYNCTGKNEASGEFIYSTLGECIIFFEKGIPDGCPILRAEGSAKITVLTENLGFRMYLYDMSGKNNVRGVEGTTIYLPTAPGLYYLNIFVDVDHPWINDEIVPVIGNQYVAQYRYLVAIVVE
jgi:hypothetical protein